MQDAKSETTRHIRSIAQDMLARGEVDVFIGYETGSLPLRTTPSFVTQPGDASRLVWGRSCENNLATYLPKFKGTVGVVVKGCDVRTLVNLLIEKQVSREQVKIVGVPCAGVIDRRRLADAVGADRPIRTAEERSRDLIVRGDGFEAAIPLEDVLSPSCATCMHPVPVLYDVLAGDEGFARKACVPEGAFREVEEFARLSADERFAYFSREIERCIECYACRQACPLCYCPECFVDRQSPKWVGRWRDLSDKTVFHLGRVLHTAGRCVDCGACRRACPAGIDLRMLAKRMEKDALVFFGHKPGTALGAVPVLATYKRDDPNDFIL